MTKVEESEKMGMASNNDTTECVVIAKERGVFRSDISGFQQAN